MLAPTGENGPLPPPATMAAVARDLASPEAAAAACVRGLLPARDAAAIPAYPTPASAGVEPNDARRGATCPGEVRPSTDGIAGTSLVPTCGLLCAAAAVPTATRIPGTAAGSPPCTRSPVPRLAGETLRPGAEVGRNAAMSNSRPRVGIGMGVIAARGSTPAAAPAAAVPGSCGNAQPSEPRR